jgi:hypothetical protein
MRKLAGYVIVAALALSSVTPALAQQRPDPSADVGVANPAFAKGTGPVVAIDSGHFEFQTIASGYSTFAALLANDGYVVQDFHDALTPASLARIRVLVIADARSALPPPDGKIVDSLSAFSDDEIRTLHDWVENGGALLICADHPPFAGSVRALAAAFGFTINRYAARARGWPNAAELFNLANGGLVAGPLTAGVDQVQTFYGTAFTAPPGATPLLKLDSSWSFAGLGVSAIPATSADWRGASLAVGKGRVVLMAEAGELSAQIAAKGGPMGFNAPDATGNKQLVRNIVRWLAIGDSPAALPPPPAAAPAPGDAKVN